MGDRTLIIGMNNPLSVAPEHALWPYPERCTGWRLWRILNARTGASRMEYVEVFDRRNLVTGKKFSAAVAKRNWRRMSKEVYDEYDTILLLGKAVQRAVGGTPLPVLGIRGSVATLPHPSGLNRWYNDAVHMAAAECLMEELYMRALS